MESSWKYEYTLCLKKVPTFILSVTLSNLNRFSISALLESVWNLLQNSFDITRLTLGMLLRYLEKLKIQIFCKYSAHMEEKLHFKCTDFNSSTRVTVYSECIYVCFLIKILFSSLITMLIVDKHCCDEFPGPRIDRKSKQVKEQWHEKFYFQSFWENSLFWTPKVLNL